MEPTPSDRLKHIDCRVQLLGRYGRQDRRTDDARSHRLLGLRPILGTNVEVTLANIGDTPVINPWIRRVGMPDTRNLQSIVDSIVKPGMSDKEKARRIWEFEINNRFHATTQDDEVADVVKRVNVYGYTLCYDESKDISDMWRAAGLKVRKGYPTGHSLAEVYYDGAWHELDSDESIISLLRDNETIASESQIVADHDLMKRTHTYGVLAPDNRLSDEGGAALIYWEGPRSGEQPSVTKHNMDLHCGRESPSRGPGIPRVSTTQANILPIQVLPTWNNGTSAGVSSRT